MSLLICALKNCEHKIKTNPVLLRNGSYYVSSMCCECCFMLTPNILASWVMLLATIWSVVHCIYHILLFKSILEICETAAWAWI